MRERLQIDQLIPGTDVAVEQLVDVRHDADYM